MRSVALRFQARWPYVVLALVLLGLLGAILILNGGHFVYTLDDPYIHLAFSEQLIGGHFGLVPQERASPSSSVLYPLLLMPLSGTPLHEFQPLFWNLLAVFAALFLWLHLLRHLVLDIGAGAILPGVLALLAMVLLNHVGLVFSGMEAGLQITLSLATAIGLIELAARDRLRWWLVAGIIAGPLIRYENLALSLPAILLLAGFGRGRMAIACGLLIGGLLGAYALYCRSIGLPPLPGSLLVKLGVDTSLGLFGFLLHEVKRLFLIVVYGRSDLPVLLLIGLLGLNFVFTRPTPRRGRERALIGFGLVVLLAQFAYGGHASLGRYDVYAWSSGLAVALYINRDAFARLAAAFGPRRAALAAAAVLVCVFPFTAFMSLATPLAANNIYLQQFQMRRFLVDFAALPALVNDAGLTAYRNPNGILDIIGLGSEEVRQLRGAGNFDAAAVQRLVERRGIELAMVYRDWLGSELPPSWIALGRLHLHRPLISAAGADVTIYATRPGAVDRLRAALQRFAATLPAGATLETVVAR
jgi:hypothetical protein